VFVKDVDLEAMPTSIFLNDDDDGDDEYVATVLSVPFFSRKRCICD